MAYYLLARTKCYEGDYCACVGYYEFLHGAETMKRMEEITWSDEGVDYEITEEYPHEAVVTNCTYDFLTERVSK